MQFDKNSNETINYYNTNASSYFESTKNADMSSLQADFLSLLPLGSRILDLGCGSGRDSMVFSQKGYDVLSVDGSIEMCKLATAYLQTPVLCSTFQAFETNEKFGGIWASASLLHLDTNLLIETVKRLSGFLLPNGCFYMSFKHGDFCGIKNGRFFVDYTEDKIRSALKDVFTLEIIKIYKTKDVRAGRENEYWINVFLRKKVYKNTTLKWISNNPSKFKFCEEIFNAYPQPCIYGVFIINKDDSEDYCAYVGRTGNLYMRFFGNEDAHYVKLRKGILVNKRIVDAMNNNNEVIEVRVLDEPHFQFENYNRDLQIFASLESEYINYYQQKGQCLEQRPDGSNINKSLWQNLKDASC